MRHVEKLKLNEDFGPQNWHNPFDKKNDPYGEEKPDPVRPPCKIDDSLIEAAGLKNLKDQVDEYITKHETGESYDDNDSDMEHYMFESVMTTFYGRDIWKYLRKFD